ncbi:hypothetical protein [Ewingella americana]|uniref:Uncharacterized protein n=1 Tax=Ewingella americana TaxID=41202 RepID=A0A502G6L5_9GAMM|nr:hypothetical protein [Ewingella americana]TPG56816.1 hypothetical protein EAH77_22345 [Ewingella americana]
MNKLPVVSVLFLIGIVANCLRELLAYSSVLTQQVLTFATFTCLILSLVVLIVSEVLAHRKARRQKREAKP